MMKSLKVTPDSARARYPSWTNPSFFIAASSMAVDERPEPIMMLGGSPIIVAAPPILEKRTSEMRIGMGLRSKTLASCMVTGVRRSMVVTLSRNADSTAVTEQRITTKVQTDPPLRL